MTIVIPRARLIPEMRKLYVHNGPGHYIGSRAAVIAFNEQEAKCLLQPALDASGLQDEEICFTEFKFNESQICDFRDGDY